MEPTMVLPAETMIWWMASNRSRSPTGPARLLEPVNLSR